MRLFYFLLFFGLRYSMRLFYPRIKTVRSPKEFLGRTIYVSNHAASFMDPLAVASMRLPIVFFMTRSDVFKPLTRPFLWAAHMLPIYRQHDGVDTKNENTKVFNQCARILSFGRNLLIFGEGFTDDVFIRRLKPVKKGAIRIGFNALEKLEWKKNIYVAAVGCNYSDPNLMRSDLLISTSEKFCLNDYKEAYLENPNKIITELTRKVEVMMQEQITHVQNKSWADFHENVMKLTRKGMNALHSNRNIPLENRWRYSQRLAHWLNEQNEEGLDGLEGLKKDLEGYFSLLKRMKLNENIVHEIDEKGTISRSTEVIKLIGLFPFALLGVLHCGLPYYFIRQFVQKSFKRKVFWGSVKMLLGMIFFGVLNLPYIFLFHAYIYPDYWLATLYFLLIGLFGLAAYEWMLAFNSFKEKGVAKKADLSKLVAKRQALIKSIKECISVA